MRCKSYCNGTNFRENKFLRIPGETRKIKHPQSILRDTTRENRYHEKLEKSMVCEIHLQKRKTLFHSLCREYLSLENIHQLGQLQLPRFISFFLWILEYIPNFS